MLKKIFIYSVLIALLLSSCAQPGGVGGASKDKKWKIGMMVIASHPSLESIQKGVKDALKEAGFEEGKNVEYIMRNAEGDIPTLGTIAQQFLDEKVDVIVATATPSMQAAYKATKDQQGPPVFFNGISNPYTAGVAEAADKHPSWMIGTQLLDPVGKVFELMKELKPELKTVGMVYNPAEANAVYLVEVAKKEAEKIGITLEFATVANTNEVQTAAETLAGQKVDALLAVNDNTVSAAFQTMAQVAANNKILLMGTSASMPGMGAAASIGIDPYEEGLDSGRMLAEYMQGKLDIAKATIQIQDAVVLTVNPKAAQDQGITLPEAVVKRANKVIE